MWLFGRGGAQTQGEGTHKTDEANLANIGPQQSRKPTMAGDNTDPASQRQDNPKAPSIPKATAASTKSPPTIKNDSYNINGQAASVGGHEDSSEGFQGMGSFLERQYRLSNREAPPAKRRKVETSEHSDSESDKRKSKSTFTGASSNGELGQHVREEREKTAAAADPTSQPIDLTNDEDDDVQFVSSNIKLKNEDKEIVCLGMLHSQANVHHIPRYGRLNQNANALGKDFYPQTSVHERRLRGSTTTIIDLFDRPANGTNMATKFGKVEMRVAAVLCPLLDCEEINGFKIRVYLDAAKKMPGEFEGARVSRVMPIRILLYSPRYKAVGIGKILSQRGHWLQAPGGVPMKRDTEIFNPHTPVTYGGKPQSSSKRLQPAYGVVRTQEEMVRETNSMFDNLIESGEIPEMEVDKIAIKTELQGLQKQALYFMTQHEHEESDDKDAQSSLWRQRETRKGTVWANIITNHELPKQPEPVRGGILADEMGLGKTLSILSLHASTVEQAKDFGDEEAPLEPETVVRNAKATLVVCPKSVMTNWIQQVKEHTYGRHFRVYQYHGSDRTQDLDELAEYDIILVPYGTVAAEFAYHNGSRNALASINWFRIVLDEAHSIRTPSTQVSKACCALNAQRRWAVTGTPVQNRLDDLGTLMKFLRIKPFDDESSWGKHIMAPLKTADENVLQHLQLLVASVTLRRTKEKVGLPKRDEHRVALDFSAEEKAMYAQFSGQANLQVRVMTRDKGRIQGKGYAFMLRSIHRLRAICAHGREMLSDDDQKELEGLTAQTAIELGDEPDPTGEPDNTFITEGQAYDFLHMMVESESDVCGGCAKHIVKRNEGEKSSTGDAESKDSDEEESETDGKKARNEDESDSDDEEDLDSEAEDRKDILGYINPCYDHLICPDCKPKYVHDAQQDQRADGYHRCPYCTQYIRYGLFELRRHALQSFLDAKSPKNKKQRTKWDESTYSGPHTKVKALVNDLKQSALESSKLPHGEPPIKSVVFSGWTTYLDLIEYALDEHGIRYTRLDGTMSIKQRTAVLSDFQTSDDLAVILVSIKAGGQGLNLTAASKVYMMEPQFNPGVEAQAIDRVHRLGQKRDVEIKHFIMRESIEEKIQKMQERKRELARLAMEKKLSRGEAAKRRIEELRELFK